MKSVVSKDRLTWFPLYPDKFLTSEACAEMSLEEKGAYVWLLFQSWATGRDCSLLADEKKLAAQIGAKKISKLVLAQFPIVRTEWGSRRRNRVLYELWLKATQKSQIRQKAAETRWSAHANAHANASAKADGLQGEREVEVEEELETDKESELEAEGRETNQPTQPTARAGTVGWLVEAFSEQSEKSFNATSKHTAELKEHIKRLGWKKVRAAFGTWLNPFGPPPWNKETKHPAYLFCMYLRDLE
jgi:uncharacterized protein YdaU (DUF1376 family)